MKHKHYAPNAELLVVEGESSAVATKMAELAEELKKQGKRVGILATQETLLRCRAEAVSSLGSRENLEEVARRLFGALRELEAQGVEVILAEGVPLRGVGVAVMNRLRKASGYRIVKAEAA
jgi:L-threonylcarbamoyladenylate synthase